MVIIFQSGLAPITPQNKNKNDQLNLKHIVQTRFMQSLNSFYLWSVIIGYPNQWRHSVTTVPPVVLLNMMS